jgi:hypothetical protein
VSLLIITMAVQSDGGAARLVHLLRSFTDEMSDSAVQTVKGGLCCAAVGV